MNLWMDVLVVNLVYNVSPKTQCRAASWTGNTPHTHSFSYLSIYRFWLYFCSTCRHCARGNTSQLYWALWIQNQSVINVFEYHFNSHRQHVENKSITATSWSNKQKHFWAPTELSNSFVHINQHIRDTAKFHSTYTTTANDWPCWRGSVCKCLSAVGCGTPSPRCGPGASSSGWW